jgi:hypothetical protein
VLLKRSKASIVCNANPVIGPLFRIGVSLGYRTLEMLDHFLGSGSTIHDSCTQVDRTELLWKVLMRIQDFTARYHEKDWSL